MNVLTVFTEQYCGRELTKLPLTDYRGKLLFGFEKVFQAFSIFYLGLNHGKSERFQGTT